ncbi:MAG: HesA/MoeB/ThiF family protein [Crocinitomicaceae bacterium]|nr:HesA/MoeB/ThiF family protein [Crocinitomicaceae bacterium]
MLSQEEKYRYSRQLNLPNVGEAGQIKLKQSSVLVVGAGGLGCPVLLYLAGAGVGQIGIIDHDKVDISNLHRQILYQTDDVGKFKAEVASEKIQRLNPTIQTTVYTEKLDALNARKIIANYDLIIDGTDNFSARYIVNDACVLENKPWVYGAIFRFEGQVSVFNYQNGPTYRCLFPEKPGNEPNCAEAGVLSVLPGMAGIYMATEAIKLILNTGELLNGKIIFFNTLHNSTYTLQLTRSAHAEIQKMGSNEDYNITEKCELNTLDLDNQTFSKMLDQGILVLDVREEWEEPKLAHEKIVHIPLATLHVRKNELPLDEDIVVICQSGGRSKTAIEILSKEYGFTRLKNLKNGIRAYIEN